MDQQNPYSAPQTNDLGNTFQQPGGLQNLGQQSRLASLKSARWTLIIVGTLITVAYSFILISMRDQMEDWGVAIMGAHLVAGVVMLGLGIAIYRIPIIATVTGLVLYGIIQLVAVVIDPANIAKGLILKIIIIVCLVNAIKAAFAYERERKNEMTGSF